MRMAALVAAWVMGSMTFVGCNDPESGSDVEELLTRYNSLVDAHEQLKKSNSQFDAQMAEKDSLITVQTTEIERLINQLKQQKAARPERVTEKVVEKEVVKEVEKEVVKEVVKENPVDATLRQKIQELESTIRDLRAQLAEKSHEQELAAANQQSDRYEAQIQSLNNQIANLNRKLSEKQAQLDAMEQQSNEKGLERNVKGLEKNIEGLEKQVEGLTQQIASLTQQVTETEQREAAAARTIAQLQSQVATQQNEIAQLRNTLAAKERELDEAQAAVAAANNAATNAANSAATAAANASNSQASIIAELNQRLAELKNLCDSYAAEIERLRAENAQLRQENEGLRTENAGLRADLNNAPKSSQEIDRLNQKIELASVLVVNNMMAVPGKAMATATLVKPATKAKQTQVVHITGQILRNNVIDPGMKSLYCRITTANNRVVAPTESFTTADGTDMQATMKQEIEFTGMARPVNMVWKKAMDLELQPGLYWVTLYCNGYEIGKTSFRLS